MRIIRWRADRKPTQPEIETNFRDEGLEFFIEDHSKGLTMPEHRHPFDEIRVVIQGSIKFNVAGNEFILREGDRLELPSNTRHWTVITSDQNCVSICAQRVGI